MNLLTGNADTENILIHLLNLNSMHNYLQLSKKNYHFEVLDLFKNNK